MKGASASRARRRAISVLPTPVGLGRDLLPQGLGHLLPAPAVPERDRHGALGARLADDVLVQLVNDFLGGHLGHGKSSGRG